MILKALGFYTDTGGWRQQATLSEVFEFLL